MGQGFAWLDLDRSKYIFCNIAELIWAKPVNKSAHVTHVTSQATALLLATSATTPTTVSIQILAGDFLFS